MNRFLLDTLFLALFFAAPFWLFFAIALFIFFRVRFVWYEFIGLGLLADIVSGPLVYFENVHIPVYTAIAIAVFFIALFIRKRMSFHV